MCLAPGSWRIAWRARFRPLRRRCACRAFAALRADDPAAAVRSFTAALAIPARAAHEAGAAAHDELMQTWRARASWRATPTSRSPKHGAAWSARIRPSQSPRLCAAADDGAARFGGARNSWRFWRDNPNTHRVALRLLGLHRISSRATRRGHRAIRGHWCATGKFLDDAFYYLALIADRHDDPEHALRLYAQVQSGENVVPALLRATAILQTHGAPTAAEELLDRLMRG